MIDNKLTFIFARVRGDYLDKLRALYDISLDIHEILQVGTLVMSLTPQPRLWRDGFVVAFYTNQSPDSIASALSESLGGFLDWTIYQGIPSFLERQKEGPLKDAAWAMKDKPVSFFFLLAKDNEFAFSRHTEEMIKSMKSSVAYTVFSFNDGIVLAVSSSEPPRIAINRCSKPLKLFSHWVFITPDGESFRDDGGKECWMDTNLIIDSAESDLDR